jgi:hypothetical protein
VTLESYQKAISLPAQARDVKGNHVIGKRAREQQGWFSCSFGPSSKALIGPFISWG